MRSEFPVLREGQMVMLAEGSHRVVRVTPCAAYVRPAYREPVMVTLPTGRTFQAQVGGSVFAISRRAAVKLVE